MINKNARLFDHVYTLPVNVFNGQIVNSSTPEYFGNYPFLWDKTVKAVSCNPGLIDPTVNPDFLLTLMNTDGEQLWYNQPISDLVQTTGGNFNLKLRLCKLKSIDLQRSYYTNVTGIGFIVTGTIFSLNFYY